MSSSQRIFEKMCQILGIKHTKTTPYHPQSNGFVERIHRVVKTALRCMNQQNQWVEQIPFIALMMNNHVTDTNFYTPFQKTFGKACKLPGLLLSAEESSTSYTGPDETTVQIFSELMSHHERSARSLNTSVGYVDKQLATANHVWVRREGIRPSLSPIYEGPFSVVRKFNKYFILLSWEGERKVSVDRLKTAYIIEEDTDEFFREDYPSASSQIIEDRQENSVSEEEEDRAVVRKDSEQTVLTRSGRTIKPPSRLDL